MLKLIKILVPTLVLLAPTVVTAHDLKTELELSIENNTQNALIEIHAALKLGLIALNKTMMIQKPLVARSLTSQLMIAETQLKSDSHRAITEAAE